MTKQCDTKYFGTYTYEQKEVLFFQNGLFGFEEEKEFLLIQFDKKNENVLCLQSLKDPNIAFFVVDPFAFLPEYRPLPSQKEMDSIGAKGIGDLFFYVICRMTDDIRTSTANLKCPIIINLHNNEAMQVILDDTAYQFRHSFSALVPNEEEEDASC